jgi:hypothetical protein
MFAMRIGLLSCAQRRQLGAVGELVIRPTITTDDY